MFHFSFWMVSIVRGATCGRALSWKNDTVVFALFLLFLMFHSSIEDVVWLFFSHYHHWCSVFETPRGQLSTCSPDDAVAVLAWYGSPRPALMKFILHTFLLFFKRTAPLIDTNIWQCLLTIRPLQSLTDFRRFTTFFRQEFDYNALFRFNVSFASLMFLTTDKTAQE